MDISQIIKIFESIENKMSIIDEKINNLHRDIQQLFHKCEKCGEKYCVTLNNIINCYKCEIKICQKCIYCYKNKSEWIEGEWVETKLMFCTDKCLKKYNEK